MKYICEKCNKEFNQKSNYDRHINRKKSCVSEEKTLQDIHNTTCEFCSHVFSQLSALKKHKNICKEKPTEMEELKTIMIQMKEIMDQQSQELKEIKNKPTNITNNNTYIQHNTINVRAYGNEDLSHLTIDDYAKIFNKGCFAIPEIAKYIYCNDEKPENRNIYIKNYKDEYILTFDGTDWNIERKDDILNNMIENKKNFLESKYDDYRKELPKRAVILFQKFLNRSDNNEVINNIKDELKNEFYKNRHHVEKKPNKKKKTNKKY